MTPAEQLAAARQNVVGPYLPAREEWLRQWVGPISVVTTGVNGTRPAGQVHSAIATPDGILYDETPDYADGWNAVSDIGCEWSTVAGVLLDVHRPEVRDHLVRLGCPEWARDVPAAVWCWGMGVEVADELGEWRKAADNDPDAGETWVRHRVHDPRNRGGGLWVAEVTQPWRDFGWECSITVDPSAPWTWLRGPETGDEGRACADVAALSAGCIVRVEGGWLVPMPGGGIGFFREVSRDE